MTEKGLSTEGELSQTHIGNPSYSQNNDNPVDKIKFNGTGTDFLRESDKSWDRFESKPPKLGNSELTLSYLCENSKLGLPDEEIEGKNILNSFDKVVSYKGKEIVSQNEGIGDSRWVEKDFLQLNELNANSLKRGVENDEIERDIMEKKPKIETLNLSLALPDVSLSLAASVLAPTANVPILEKPTWYALAPLNNNIRMTQSNDLSFTAASMSYSCSHPFSHNPSCSLTRNSTDFDYSVASHRRDCDQIWNAEEGTNGSVHSRFRPVGDGLVALSNHGSSVFSFMQNRGVNRDNNNNSLHNGTSSDNLSFFPSELPPRPRMEAQSSDSRGRGLENVRESLDGVQARKLSRPEKIIKEIVSESLPVMSQIVQELTEETIESVKEHLKTLISSPERRHELMSLQNRLAGRSDLTKETLSKCPRTQLDIFVSIKVGLVSFLSNNVLVSVTELVEIYLLERCRNMSCKRLLPVEDCECKICSIKKGFCSECMCPICFKFDCASNTCSWVGCDVCSHWCHAACGLQKNLIKPSLKPKGPAGTTEVHFQCLGCDHASEMFGFVKDVFMNCATRWDLETLVKELECVRKIFKESEDYKGRELRTKAEEMIIRLESKMISPLDACNFIFQFFKCTDGLSEFPSSSATPKDIPPITQNTLRKDASPHQIATTFPPKPSFYNPSLNNRILELNPNDLHQSNSNLNASLMAMTDKNIEDEWSVKAATKKDKDNGFDSLESIVRIKEVEERMFQSRADEARREAENYRRMVQVKSEKLDEEYGEMIVKLCLQETEERRRKKVEEMKLLENLHCDYYKMKLRMQAEIAGLLERMEATKQQLV